MREQSGGYLARPQPSGLADVVEIVLDRGIVIDAYARVSVVGIELLTIDARVVVSSVDTYLRFAEATNRLDLWDKGGRTLPEILNTELQSAVTSIASSVVEHKVDDALDSVGDTFGAGAEKVARSAAGTVAGKLVDAAEAVAARSDDSDDDSGEDSGDDPEQR